MTLSGECYLMMVEAQGGAHPVVLVVVQVLLHHREGVVVVP